MTDYHTDFALWAREQATRLRTGAAGLDRDNIAEELDALARALHHELDGRLARSRCCNRPCSRVTGGPPGMWRSRKSVT